MEQGLYYTTKQLKELEESALPDEPPAATTPARLRSFERFEEAPRWDEQPPDFWSEFENVKAEASCEDLPFEIAVERLEQLGAQAGDYGLDENEDAKARKVFLRFLMRQYPEKGTEFVNVVKFKSGSDLGRAWETVLDARLERIADEKGVDPETLTRKLAALVIEGAPPELWDAGHAKCRAAMRKVFGDPVAQRCLEKALAVFQPTPESTEKPTQPMTPPADWLRPGERLAADPVAAVRVSTGLTTLDAVLGGGAPEGATVIILGAPDAGKSAVALQTADRAERQGCAVVVYAPDSGPEAAEVRLGQMAGFNRDKLEERDPETIAKVQGAFATRNIWIPDPFLFDAKGHPVNTLETIGKKAREIWPTLPIVLVCDSVQEAIPDEAKHAGEREKTMAVMRQLKMFAVLGGIALATSQVNRASYRNKRDSENADPMSGGSESSKVEYAAEILVFLTGDPTSPEGATLRVLKNKPGSGRKPKAPIRLTYSPASSTFSELDAAAVAGQVRESESAATLERERLRGEVYAALQKAGRLTYQGVYDAVSGQDARKKTALLELEAAGKVTMEKTAKGHFWTPKESLLDLGPE